MRKSIGSLVPRRTDTLAGDQEFGKSRLPQYKEIVLGARMSDELQSKAVKMARAANPTIVIKKSVLHKSTFKILIEGFED